MQLFKSGLKALLVFSLLVFTASEVAAKKPDGKPGGKPPPNEDSCTGLQAPDYAFWRDARTKGKDRMAQVAVYVAESDTGCEAKLLDIQLPEGPINDLQLTFSSVVVDDVFSGRIVWRKEIADGAYSVWKHDFTINEGSVDGGDGPIMIMVNTGEKDLRIYDLDLSPDTKSLVYRLVEYYEEPYFSTSSIRKVEIADCLDVLCEFSEEPSISIYSGEDTPSTYFFLRSPVWGPLGNRIYFVERWGDYSYDINATDISGEPFGTKTLATLILDEDPDSAYVREISSGIGYVWPGAKEYLTVSIGELHTHGCAFVYSLDVDACKTGCASTALIPMFAGIWPSWTRNGRIIHTHQGMAMKDNCTTDTVGSWDGTNLETLLKGYEPEAAGG